MSRDKKEKSAHPWRDNIEAITVSIVIIVLFKYFVLEAYKIPTGSMQPTLMGWSDDKGGGIFDRVLVDKLAYHYRDPERFEVVVFKYPLDRSKNFIKRILGMPGEVLEVRYGDVWQGLPGEELKPLRRPKPVQRAQLKRIDTTEQWRIESGPWTSGSDELHAKGAGRAVFPSKGGVRDHYTDGYPPKLAERLQSAGKGSGDNEVGDLRLECRVEADAACVAVVLELFEGGTSYSLRLPGPAAEPDARPTIRLVDGRGQMEAHTVQADAPYRLPAGRSVTIAGQNLDDLLQLEVAGETVLSLEVPPVPDGRGSRVALSSEGGGADFERVRVFRDIYYTTARQKVTRWEIPAGHYVMLGDNTQDSSDSRDWSLSRYEVSGEYGPGAPEHLDPPVLVRGNDRSRENPRFTQLDGQTVVTFYDELGERWVFTNRQSRRLESEACSFVPRELIRGRAVLVVWPFVPSMDVYRIKWVR